MRVRLGQRIFECQVAVTPEEHALGLSKHARLHSDEGMLFIFPKVGTRTFWMSDVQFPIDILGLDADSRVTRIVDSAQPGSYERWTFPRVAAVLEVPGGSCRRHGIRVGSQLVEHDDVGARTASGRDIVVTIPKSKMKSVEAEEADVARRISNGEQGLGYFWQMGMMPKEQPERIFFVWDGAVRAYHDVTGMDRSAKRIYMDPTIHDLESPIPMGGFRGFRYMNDDVEPRTAQLHQVAPAHTHANPAHAAPPAPEGSEDRDVDPELQTGERFKVGRYGPTWTVQKASGSSGLCQRDGHKRKWFGYSHNRESGDITIYPVRQGTGDRAGKPVAFGPLNREDDEDEGEVTKTARDKGQSLAEMGERQPVRIYRAVKEGDMSFHPMDYVTRSMKFARQHAEHIAAVEEENASVLTALAAPEHVFEAYNPGEFFYDGPPLKVMVAKRIKAATLGRVAISDEYNHLMQWEDTEEPIEDHAPHVNTKPGGKNFDEPEAEYYKNLWGPDLTESAMEPRIDGPVTKHIGRLVCAVKRSPLGEKELKQWFEGDDTVTFISAKESESSMSQAKEMHGRLLRDLEALGIPPKFIKQTRGRWEERETGNIRPEPSLAIRGLTFEQALALAKKYQQEGFIFKQPDGSVAMYENYRDKDLQEGKQPIATIPTRDGRPLFGLEAINVQPRQPKEKRRDQPPENDLWVGSRSMTFEIPFDWDDEERVKPWSGVAPMTRDQIHSLYETQEGTRPQRPTTQAPGAPEGEGDNLPEEAPEPKVAYRKVHPNALGSHAKTGGAGGRKKSTSADAFRFVRQKQAQIVDEARFVEKVANVIFGKLSELQWSPDVLNGGATERAVVTRRDLAQWLGGSPNGVGNAEQGSTGYIVQAASSDRGMRLIGDAFILAGLADMARLGYANRSPTLVLYRETEDSTEMGGGAFA